MSNQSVTAWDVASDPDLFNRVWRLGSRGRIGWECNGISRDEQRVRFSRLTPELRQMDRWVSPDLIVSEVER